MAIFLPYLPFTVPKGLDSASLIISLELPITLLRHLQ
ncbi:hypothetical protein PMI27_000437 [Pseudomonas sp. GM41(2012)]|jgi:hypothetical protein|nr:hypothetical protein PMI27_000437 [Pseudomonas sp. GM41(2012)]